ncbi:MAG TPA: response regulator [Azoarcus taiwanensis]|nr:response regulator [Azoarcus taiwanensis]
MNLCINARDALDGRGTIRIAIEHPAPSVAVCASCRASVASSGHLALLVGDDGPGIPSNVLERMFEPFFSTKPVGKGSGMGLATVHGIVHEHGGHILIDSRPGGGTAFRVLLPRVTPSGEVCGIGRSSPEESSRPALSGRVLVVDDEAMVTGFLEELLHVWGLEVVLAHDGLEGCERFVTDPEGFDLVLTDQTMPHRTGLEMAAEIHRANPSVPILLFSGYAEDVPEHVLASAGVRALLAKPVEPENLLALLTELLMPSPA